MWNKATTCVHNLLGGQRWVDHYGEVNIVNKANGISCKLTYSKVTNSLPTLPRSPSRPFRPAYLRLTHPEELYCLPALRLRNIATVVLLNISLFFTRRIQTVRNIIPRTGTNLSFFKNRSNGTMRLKRCSLCLENRILSLTE